MSAEGDALRQAAFEVLEEGLFLFLEDDEASGPYPLCFSMRIDEAGERRCEIGLQVGEEVGSSLASNMLGIDADEVSQAERDAAVAEALNILAGKVLGYALGMQPELELCPPVQGGEPHGETLALKTADGPLLLWYAP